MFASQAYVRTILDWMLDEEVNSKPMRAPQEYARRLSARYGVHHRIAAFTVLFVLDRISEQLAAQAERTADAGVVLGAPTERIQHLRDRASRLRAEVKTLPEQGEWDNFWSPYYRLDDDPRIQQAWFFERAPEAGQEDPEQPGIQRSH